MRLAEGHEAIARATIEAALDAGITIFDTARAYGESERIVGDVLRGKPVTLVTKCGMVRDPGVTREWRPDGRASAILADVRKSVEALRMPIDVLLLHAPDPNVPFETSLRALARAKEEGLVRAIGLSNIKRKQLELAATTLTISAVEVAIGAYDDAAARGGVIPWCADAGALLFAHSPLGGPKNAPKLARDPVLRSIAERYGATAAELVLAYLLALHPKIIPLVGARRPESVASAVRASALVLDEADLVLLDARFPGLGLVRSPPIAPAASEREVVIVMGIPGAGKSRFTESLVARGHARLNRDTIGGTLSGIAKRLDELLRAGTTHVVLDNTYVTRALRSEVVRLAHKHGAAVRCVFVDTPMHEAQANIVHRMLDKHELLLGGPELAARARRDPGLLLPTALFRMEKELERPSADEGFHAIEVVPFARDEKGRRAGSAIPIEVVASEANGKLALRTSVDAALSKIPEGPILLFAFRPGADEGWRTSANEIASTLAEAAGRIVEAGVCGHGVGPPVCWCRPPLPGLWVAFARRHGVTARGSIVIATSPSHRTFATALGLDVIETISSRNDGRAR